MDLEYNADLDEYYIVMPESLLEKLGWEEGDMLEYELDDDLVRIFKI